MQTRYSPEDLGRLQNDTNPYFVGAIGVVLVRQPRMGKATDANVDAGCSMSITNTKLVLISGVCGGNPTPSTKEKVLLGGVLFSKGIVQYNFDRSHPHKIRRKDIVDDQMGRCSRKMSSLLSMLETNLHRSKLQVRVAEGDILGTCCCGGLGCLSHGTRRSEKAPRRERSALKKGRNLGLMSQRGTCRFPSYMSWHSYSELYER